MENWLTMVEVMKVKMNRLWLLTKWAATALWDLPTVVCDFSRVCLLGHHQP